MSSLYYDPYNNDIDLMNLLMEKHGRARGEVEFRDIKTACGYEEVTSYEGAAEITRWVKRRKARSIRESAKKDAKPDPDTAKEEAAPAAAATPPAIAAAAPPPAVTTQEEAEPFVAPPRVQRRRRINRAGIMATVSVTSPGCFEDIECQDHGAVCECIESAALDCRAVIWVSIPVNTWKCTQCSNKAIFVHPR